MLLGVKSSCAIFLCAFASGLFGQIPEPKTILPKSTPPVEDDEMVTDRPDFTESAATVRPSWYQLETGFAVSWETNREGKVRSVAFPYPLMRIGITRRLEFRYSTDGYARNRFFNHEGQSLNQGHNDLEVGLKYVAWYEKKFLPQFALIGQVSEPLGAASLSSGSIDPKFKICWSKDFSGGWGLSGNFNYFYLTEDRRRFLERDTSVSLGHDLVAGFKGYVEFYRLANITLDKEALSIAQVGWARPIKGNFQFDMSVAKTIAHSMPQWSIMGGFTYRAPVPGSILRRN
ncbi:MAG: transporter [Acidobacteria bacterium]|nr:transporter [Acidobacteriota bacterium]